MKHLSPLAAILFLVTLAPSAVGAAEGHAVRGFRFLPGAPLIEANPIFFHDGEQSARSSGGDCRLSAYVTGVDAGRAAARAGNDLGQAILTPFLLIVGSRPDASGESPQRMRLASGIDARHLAEGTLTRNDTPDATLSFREDFGGQELSLDCGKLSYARAAQNLKNTFRPVTVRQADPELLEYARAHMDVWGLNQVSIEVDHGGYHEVTGMRGPNIYTFARTPSGIQRVAN